MAQDTSSDTTTPTVTSNGRRRYLDLFLISFLILFFELACIRWFGATVMFLTFFTNLVLMACFLGMSVGLMSAGRRQDLLDLVLPLALLAVSAAVFMGSTRVASEYVVDVGRQKSPQEVFFGTEPEHGGDVDTSRYVIPIEVLAGGFFVLIALTFVGLGQVMGRAFDAIPDRVVAYTVDILGSLAGIAAFGAASWLRWPPELWFTVIAALILWFFRRLTWLQAACAVLLVGLIGWWGYREATAKIVIWSPYYKIFYNQKQGSLTTNNIGHQMMVDVGETGAAYYLPHVLNKDASGTPFSQVMIIGAGSGNDVTAALANGAAHVDAVEIEPVLNAVGRSDHPRQPYSDPRVTIHLDDGRSFVRRTEKKYDMVTYALVDSLVLHSGYSSLRLESFLFTEQAFRDVKDKLDDDGVFVMYNYYRQGWIVGRLFNMAQKVFDAEPIVLGLPYQASIKGTDGALGNNFTTIIVGKKGSKRLEAIRKKFAEEKLFWVHGRPLWNKQTAAFGPKPPTLAGASFDGWQKIGPAAVDPAGSGPIPTDDWPFLYLKDKSIPTLNLRGMGLIAFLSLVILFTFAPLRTARPNGRMFFLGAGFMLLETKGVVHLALLFGSTWIVNSVVFFAILVMILFSNLYVLALKPQKLTPYYLALLAALVVNALVPMDVFLGLPGYGRIAATVAVVFIPIFFAGVIFASSFAGSLHPDVDFGSNIAGVILGGLSENLSLMFGFDEVLLVAVAFYLLSAALGARVRVAAA
jgi:Spermine/spermidine synthase domain